MIELEYNSWSRGRESSNICSCACEEQPRQTIGMKIIMFADRDPWILAAVPLARDCHYLRYCLLELFERWDRVRVYGYHRDQQCCGSMQHRKVGICRKRRMFFFPRHRSEGAPEDIPETIQALTI
jgi:hypothetical protein